MAQSVKLKDGSYIDATGVYDTTQGKTQAEVNASQSESNEFLPNMKQYWNDKNDKSVNIDSMDYGIYVATSLVDTGTFPSSLSGNRWLIIQMTNLEKFNAQLAFGMAVDKIAFRRKTNSTTWTAWKYLTFT